MEEILTDNETNPGHGILLTHEAQYYLNEGAGWAKFLGIIGFIFCAFIVILALSIGSIFAYIAQFSPRPTLMPAAAGTIFGVIYGLMALLYFFPAFYLFKFGVKAKKGVLYHDIADVTAAVSNLKSFLKFFGIITIIMLAFMVLGFIGLFMGAAAMHGLR